MEEPSDPSASRVSERVSAVEPQGIRVMFDLAAEAESRGETDLIHLELGEPDFETPAHVVEAAHEAAASGRTNYTHNAGIPELRAAIAERVSGPDRPVDPDSEVVVTTGGVEALYLSILAAADPGQEVVVPTPA